MGVAGIVEPTFRAAEIRRAVDRPTNDLTAYDLYLRALSHSYSDEKGRIVLALDLLERAIEHDPRYGPALALAARNHTRLHVIGTEDQETHRRKGVDLAHEDEAA